MKKILISLILLVFSSAIFSQSRFGTPAYKTYNPLEYKLHPQVWTITQLKNGYIFMGTFQGAALYDGNEFFTIIPRTISIRDVMEDTTTNRIYYGGDVNFGYLEKNGNGRYKIKDLSRSLPDSLNDFVVVLGIEKIKDKIYFFALRYIWEINPFNKII